MITTREREREERRENLKEKQSKEREERRGEERRENLKEKQSKEISCLHERLFLVKISLENPTKSIKIQFIKQSFKI